MKDFLWGISLFEIPQEYKEGDLDRAKNLGMNAVRFHFSWRDIETKQGEFNFSFYDKLIEDIKKKGLKILSAIGCAYSHMLPPWILKEHKERLNLLSYIPKLSTFVNKVVERYKELVDVWQVENEINHTTFHAKVGWRSQAWILNPLAEVSVLVSIICVIKAEARDAKILINLLCDNPNWYFYLKLFLKKELPFEIFGIDFYPCYSPVFSENDMIFSSPDRILTIEKIIRKAQRKLKLERKNSKDIMIVESGYPAQIGSYTYKNQAEYIHKLSQVIKTFDKIKALFIWQLADQFSKKPHFPEYYFGLYTNERQEKLACKILKEEVENKHHCIFICIKGLLFREPKCNIEIYINNKYEGKTDLCGYFMSKNLPVGRYLIKIKGLFPWQRRKKEIELKEDRPIKLNFLI